MKRSSARVRSFFFAVVNALCNTAKQQQQRKKKKEMAHTRERIETHTHIHTLFSSNQPYDFCFKRPKHNAAAASLLFFFSEHRGRKNTRKRKRERKGGKADLSSFGSESKSG